MIKIFSLLIFNHFFQNLILKVICLKKKQKKKKKKK